MNRYIPIGLICICLAMSAPLAADVERFPALYQVTGVRSDDILNIRREPSATSAKIGAFAFDQSEIEVVDLSTDEKWALINFEGQSGWTAVLYLQLMAGQPFENLPEGMLCSGTEPFWDLRFGQNATARGDWSIMGYSPEATDYSGIWTGSPEKPPAQFLWV